MPIFIPTRNESGSTNKIGAPSRLQFLRSLSQLALLTPHPSDDSALFLVFSSPDAILLISPKRKLKTLHLDHACLAHALGS